MRGALDEFALRGSSDQGFLGFVLAARTWADLAEDGTETTIDFLRMMRIVVASGYCGHVGIEYEGNELGEIEGIRATQSLLEVVREQLTS